MQIQCSQLKHEVIEDKTVFSVKSHFKRKGLELTLDLSLKLKLYSGLDYDFTELSNKEAHAIGNCKDKVKQ